MTKGKTVLIQNDPLNETDPKYYMPITCLMMMWKIFTAQIRKEIYYTLKSRGLLHRSVHPKRDQLPNGKKRRMIRSRKAG